MFILKRWWHKAALSIFPSRYSREEKKQLASRDHRLALHIMGSRRIGRNLEVMDYLEMMLPHMEIESFTQRIDRKLQNAGRAFLVLAENSAVLDFIFSTPSLFQHFCQRAFDMIRAYLGHVNVKAFCEAHHQKLYDIVEGGEPQVRFNFLLEKAIENVVTAKYLLRENVFLDKLLQTHSLTGLLNAHGENSGFQKELSDTIQQNTNVFIEFAKKNKAFAEILFSQNRQVIHSISPENRIAIFLAHTKQYGKFVKRYLPKILIDKNETATTEVGTGQRYTDEQGHEHEGVTSQSNASYEAYTEVNVAAFLLLFEELEKKDITIRTLLSSYANNDNPEIEVIKNLQFCFEKIGSPFSEMARHDVHFARMMFTSNLIDCLPLGKKIAVAESHGDAFFSEHRKILLGYLTKDEDEAIAYFSRPSLYQQISLSDFTCIAKKYGDYGSSDNRNPVLDSEGYRNTWVRFRDAITEQAMRSRHVMKEIFDDPLRAQFLEEADKSAINLHHINILLKGVGEGRVLQLSTDDIEDFFTAALEKSTVARMGLSTPSILEKLTTEQKAELIQRHAISGKDPTFLRDLQRGDIGPANGEAVKLSRIAGENARAFRDENRKVANKLLIGYQATNQTDPNFDALLKLREPTENIINTPELCASLSLEELEQISREYPPIDLSGPLSVLQITKPEPKASDVKRAYIKLSRQNHTDKTGSDDHDKMSALNDANKVAVSELKFRKNLSTAIAEKKKARQERLESRRTAKQETGASTTSAYDQMNAAQHTLFKKSKQEEDKNKDEKGKGEKKKSFISRLFRR